MVCVVLRRNPTFSRLTRYSSRQCNRSFAPSLFSSSAENSRQGSHSNAEVCVANVNDRPLGEGEKQEKILKGEGIMQRDTSALPSLSMKGFNTSDRRDEKKRPLMLVDASAVPFRMGVRALLHYPFFIWDHLDGWWRRGLQTLFRIIDHSFCGRHTISRRWSFCSFYVVGIVTCLLLWSSYPHTPCRESAEIAVRYAIHQEESTMKSGASPISSPHGRNRLPMKGRRSPFIQDLRFEQQWKTFLRSHPWLYDTPFVDFRNISLIQKAHHMYMTDIQQCEAHLAPLGGEAGTLDIPISWERLPLLLFGIHCFIRLLESLAVQAYSKSREDRVTLFALLAGCGFYMMASISFDLSALSSLREEEARRQFQRVHLLPTSTTLLSSDFRGDNRSSFRSSLSQEPHLPQESETTMVLGSNSSRHNTSSLAALHARRFSDFMMEADHQSRVVGSGILTDVPFGGWLEVLARVVQLGPWYVPRILLLFLIFIYIVVQCIQSYHHDLLASLRRGTAMKAKREEQMQLASFVRKVWRSVENKNLGEVVVDHCDKNDTKRYTRVLSSEQEEEDSDGAKPDSRNRHPFSPVSGGSSFCPSSASSPYSSSSFSPGTLRSVVKQRGSGGANSPYTTSALLRSSSFSNAKAREFSAHPSNEEVEMETKMRAIRTRKRLYEAVHDDAVWLYHFPSESLFQIILEPHYLCEILLYLIQCIAMLIILFYNVFSPAARKKYTQLLPWIRRGSRSFLEEGDSSTGMALPTNALSTALLLHVTCALGVLIFTTLNLSVTAIEHREYWEQLNEKRLIVKEFVLQYILRPEDDDMEDENDDEWGKMKKGEQNGDFFEHNVDETASTVNARTTSSSLSQAKKIERRVLRRRFHRHLYSATDPERIPVWNFFPLLW